MVDLVNWCNLRSQKFIPTETGELRVEWLQPDDLIGQRILYAKEGKIRLGTVITYHRPYLYVARDPWWRRVLHAIREFGRRA